MLLLSEGQAEETWET